MPFSFRLIIERSGIVAVAGGTAARWPEGAACQRNDHHTAWQEQIAHGMGKSIDAGHDAGASQHEAEHAGENPPPHSERRVANLADAQ
jgi:hypothetical protein